MKKRADPIDLGNWTTQMRKGLLELCIVNLLGQGEMYAYDLVKQLSRMQGVVITEGTVYPLMSRLRKAGLIETRLEESSAGPARKYYRLTGEGKRAKELMNRYWLELSVGINKLVESEVHDD